jgi:hypothetical protein
VQVDVVPLTVWRELPEQQLTSLPSTACTVLDTVRLSGASNVLLVVFAVMWSNHYFLTFMIVTIKVQFTRNGIQNIHNQDLRADENLHMILPSDHQYQSSINI